MNAAQSRAAGASGPTLRWLVQWDDESEIVIGEVDAAWEIAASMIARSGKAPGPDAGYPRVTPAPIPDVEREAIQNEPPAAPVQAPDPFPPGRYVATGDTYPQRGALSRAGFGWVAHRKAWIGDATAARAAGTLPGVDIAREDGPRPAAAPRMNDFRTLNASKVSTLVAAPAPSAPVAVATPAPAPIERGKTVDAVGALRSTVDLEAAKAAGWAPAQPLYTRGTMVVEAGISNARSSRAEYEALPTVWEAMSDLSAAVDAEKRVDVTVDPRGLRMGPDGALTRDGMTGHIAVDAGAFPALCARAGLPGGAGGYLSACPPDLRALNWEAWRAIERTVDPMVLRTREAGDGSRAAFAVVSDRYAAVDVGQIAAMVRDAMPEDARAIVAYDGRKAQIDVEFHSTVQPEDYVAGEFFRSGIRISTDDTGGGSLRGSAFVVQNLCLNLIILDRAEKPLFVARHLGDRRRVISKLREGLRAGLDSMRHFLDAWGYARATSILDEIRAAHPALSGDMPSPSLNRSIQTELLLAGLVDALRDKEMVPLTGKRQEVRNAVLRRWREDPNQAPIESRARVVNALTSYAARDVQDPWQRGEIEKAAGSLLWSPKGGRPAPLPWAPPV
jgi:hypothetical protein